MTCNAHTARALLRASALPLSEARALLCHVTGRAREYWIAHDDEVMNEEAALRFRELAARRAAGEPLAYLTGAREFHGRPFHVSPAVLIPRPETELLCEAVLQRMPPQAPRILDLGTGSGAIAITLALECPGADITATDVSAAALEVAGCNARNLGARLRFKQGSWYEAVDGATFDVIASNPPYIAAGDEHLSQGDLRYEPPAALTDGADGLTAIRSIVAGAGARLAPGGWLLLEHGYDQSDAVRALLAAAGFAAVQSLPDLAGIPRVSLGRWPGNGGAGPDL
jgi:release factor glutamine methyltransferase